MSAARLAKPFADVPNPHQHVALVTGAAGAIGTAIVGKLIARDMWVVALDRNAEISGRLAQILSESESARCAVVVADLTMPSAPEAVMAIIETIAGRLDHLINNAARNEASPIGSVDLLEWDRTMSINLRAPMALVQAALPFWKRQGHGCVVNIGSRVWLSGASPTYTASKAGLVGLTRSLAVQLGPLGVTANLVAPAYVDTSFTRDGRAAEDIEEDLARVRSMSPLGRIGTPMDVAGTVAFLLSDDAGFITGETLHVCGGAQLAARSSA